MEQIPASSDEVYDALLDTTIALAMNHFQDVTPEQIYELLFTFPFFKKYEHDIRRLFPSSYIIPKIADFKNQNTNHVFFPTPGWFTFSQVKALRSKPIHHKTNINQPNHGGTLVDPQFDKAPGALNAMPPLPPKLQVRKDYHLSSEYVDVDRYLDHVLKTQLTDE